MNTSEKLGTILGALALVALAALILALPTQLLWNYCLVPAVNSVNPIGFFQALGINMLASILFKSTTSNAKTTTK
jgi:hypothetical protein